MPSFSARIRNASKREKCTILHLRLRKKGSRSFGMTKATLTKNVLDKILEMLGKKDPDWYTSIR